MHSQNTQRAPARPQDRIAPAPWGVLSGLAAFTALAALLVGLVASGGHGGADKGHGAAARTLSSAEENALRQEIADIRTQLAGRAARCTAPSGTAPSGTAPAAPLAPGARPATGGGALPVPPPEGAAPGGPGTGPGNANGNANGASEPPASAPPASGPPPTGDGAGRGKGTGQPPGAGPGNGAGTGQGDGTGRGTGDGPGTGRDGGAPPPASPPPPPPPPPPPMGGALPAACVEPPAQSADPNVVMIFDTSLSMRLPVSLTLREELRLRGGRPDGPTEGTLTALMEQPGEKRLDVARQSAGSILRSLPPKVPFGLVLFGRNVEAPPGPLPHADACDVTALAPATGPDRPRHAQALNSFPPRAWTPIARSLEESSAMLSTVEGRDSHVLLLTDGLESCHRDPCAEARRLKARHPNARVHVIDIMGSEQLACIAQETGGDILRSNDPAEIARFALAIVDPGKNCPK